MTYPEISPLSKRIRKILSVHHHNGVTAEDCISCASGCCSQGGFAILENVLLIYDHYKKGNLQREDFEYELGLSFKDFVFTYFDVYTRETGNGFLKRDVVLFHMKSISNEGNLISIPGIGYYYDVRSAWFEVNLWMNKGCVFLSKKVPNWPEDDGLAERHCILHETKSNTHLTKKPIDCIFYTCDEPMKARVPDERVSSRWFRALALDYPKSVQRFEALIK